MGLQMLDTFASPVRSVLANCECVRNMWPTRVGARTAATVRNPQSIGRQVPQCQIDGKGKDRPTSGREIRANSAAPALSTQPASRAGKHDALRPSRCFKTLTAERNLASPTLEVEGRQCAVLAETHCAERSVGMQPLGEHEHVAELTDRVRRNCKKTASTYAARNAS